MANNTPNLELYKKDPVTDGLDTFNIQTMLNENWDKIDDSIGDKTIDDTLIPATDTGLSVKILLSWLANMIKSITGKASWRIKPTKNLEELNTDIGNHIANSVGHGTSSKAEAQAGTSHASYMTPLRVAEAIASLQAVSSVNGKKGAVTLNNVDVGLNNVINVEQVNSVSIGNNSDPNTTQTSYILTNHVNAPYSGGFYWHILTLFHTSKTGGRSQIAISYNSNTGVPRMLYRQCFNGLWAPWTEDFNQRNYGNVVGYNLPATLTENAVNTVIVAQTQGIITVPTNASVPMSIGTQITVISGVGGNVTFAPSSGVTLSSKESKRTIDGQYAVATLIKTSENGWVLIGALK